MLVSTRHPAADSAAHDSIAVRLLPGCHVLVSSRNDHEALRVMRSVLVVGLGQGM